MDLDEGKRTSGTHEGTPAADAALAEAAEDEQKKKKKKKKRIRIAAPAPVPEETDELLRKAKKKKKLKFQEVNKEEVEDAIKRTLAEMDEASVVTQRATFKRKRKEKRMMEEQRQLEEKQRELKILRVTEFVSVNELANLMGVNAADVIKKCIELGLMVSINQRLAKGTITLVADEFGFSVKFFSELTADGIEDEPEDDTMLRPRPPVVTIMGHVDH